MSAVCSAISSQLIASNFSSVLIVFHSFFSWTALGTVHLQVSVIFITKANAVKGGTSPAWLHHQLNQSIHVTGGMTVMSISASPPTLDKSGHGMCMSHRVKPKNITYLQCQMALYQNYHKDWESGVNFQVILKQIYTKRNHVKQDLPVFFHGFSQPWSYSAIVSEIDHICYALSCVIICYIKFSFI